jgi:hypothetical protein
MNQGIPVFRGWGDQLLEGIELSLWMCGQNRLHGYDV